MSMNVCSNKGLVGCVLRTWWVDIANQGNSQKIKYPFQFLILDLQVFLTKLYHSITESDGLSLRIRLWESSHLHSFQLDLQAFDAIWLCNDLFSHVKICNSLIFQVIYWKGLKWYLLINQRLIKNLRIEFKVKLNEGEITNKETWHNAQSNPLL